MIDKFEDEVALFFDGCAAEGIFDSFAPEDEAKINMLLELWDIQPGQRILEPGCGSGRLTEILACEIGDTGEIFACDLSAEMISIAKKRKLPGTVTFSHGSLNNIPCNDSYFDIVICFQVFPHFLDQERSLTKIASLLKPAGDLWINHLESRNAINTKHKNASGVVISHQIPPSEEMLRLMKHAGFETIFVEEDSPHGYSAHVRKKAQRTSHKI